ncbi:MAG: ArnT family glycosyltransferase [Bacteroidia bacterium]
MYFAIRSWNPAVEKGVIFTGDPVEYESLAENILHYHTYAGAFDTLNVQLNSNLLKIGDKMNYADTYRLPGYPVFLAIVYYISGIKPFVAIFLQILLNIISVVLIYRITLLLFNIIEVAIIAGLLFAIDIHSIYVANLLYSDTLFIFFFLLSLYIFVTGLQKKSVRKFIISAIFMGLACLTRPVTILYPFILTFILFLYNKQQWKWVLKIMAFYCLITYIMVGTFVLRNHITYGKWELTSEDGFALLLCNVAFTESRKSLVPIETIRTNLLEHCDSLGCARMRNPFDHSAVFRKVAMEYIKKNPVEYIKTQVWGALHMFLSLGNIDMAKSLGWKSSNVEGQIIMDTQRLKQNFSYKRQALLGALILVLLMIQYTGALLGMYFLVKNHNYIILILCILTLLYFSVITGSMGMYRYKLPVEFVICSIGGYGYYSLKKRQVEL